MVKLIDHRLVPQEKPVGQVCYRQAARSSNVRPDLTDAVSKAVPTQTARARPPNAHLLMLSIRGSLQDGRTTSRLNLLSNSPRLSLHCKNRLSLLSFSNSFSTLIFTASRRLLAGVHLFLAKRPFLFGATHDDGCQPPLVYSKTIV